MPHPHTNDLLASYAPTEEDIEQAAKTISKIIHFMMVAAARIDSSDLVEAVDESPPERKAKKKAAKKSRKKGADVTVTPEELFKELRQRFQNIAQQGRASDLGELLDLYDAAKLSEVPVSQYSDLSDRLTALERDINDGNDEGDVEQV